uniref:Uncharacterized protein n=1 Tax=Urocitellus parryii TaxID=9999 RepID=A0A8D2HHX1_UROPR
MAFIPELQEGLSPPPSLLLQLRRRKWKQRNKNLRSLTMTWDLIFLTKPLL